VEGRQRVLGVARQRKDGPGLAKTLGHEERRDQVAGREGGLGDQATNRGGSTEAPRALRGKHVD
jgi:hypothetical protein